MLNSCGFFVLVTRSKVLAEGGKEFSNILMYLACVFVWGFCFKFASLRMYLSCLLAQVSEGVMMLHSFYLLFPF